MSRSVAFLSSSPPLVFIFDLLGSILDLLGSILGILAVFVLRAPQNEHLLAARGGAFFCLLGSVLDLLGSILDILAVFV